jgi:hypothetical protein
MPYFSMNAVYIIRKDNLEAEQEVTTLRPDKRALNVKYVRLT